jgi:putative pyruvate formate lyase activating enzyme
MPTNASYCYLDKEEWDRRITALDRLAVKCALCPRRCGIDRLAGQQGFCRAANRMRISSVFPHHGEEPPI